MSDAAALVKRLRSQAYWGDIMGEAADMIEEQAKEISQHQVDVNEALLDCKSLHARIAELEAALRPFADEYDMHEPGKFPDDFYVDLETGLTIGQFRAARVALKGEK